jgi:hypothetical protein
VKTVTDALDVVGCLVVAAALALGAGVAVAAATSPACGWPAGLLVGGGGILAVSWWLDYLAGAGPADDESETE